MMLFLQADNKTKSKDKGFEKKRARRQKPASLCLLRGDDGQQSWSFWRNCSPEAHQSTECSLPLLKWEDQKKRRKKKAPTTKSAAFSLHSPHSWPQGSINSRFWCEEHRSARTESLDPYFRAGWNVCVVRKLPACSKNSKQKKYYKPLFKFQKNEHVCCSVAIQYVLFVSRLGTSAN